MEKQNKEIKTYTAPKIEIIEVDNEISLALESTPPDGPEEGYISSNEYNSSPYQ